MKVLANRYIGQSYTGHNYISGLHEEDFGRRNVGDVEALEQLAELVAIEPNSALVQLRRADAHVVVVHPLEPSELRYDGAL